MTKLFRQMCIALLYRHQKLQKHQKVVIVSPKRTPKSILKKSKKSLFETQDSEMPDAKRIKIEMPS